jgi:hypothetical protein
MVNSPLNGLLGERSPNDRFRSLLVPILKGANFRLPEGRFCDWWTRSSQLEKQGSVRGFSRAHAESLTAADFMSSLGMSSAA